MEADLDQSNLDAYIELFELLAEIEQSLEYTNTKRVEKGSEPDEGISSRQSVE